MNPIETALTDIEQTPDLLKRALMLSGLVTKLFSEAGFELVVVGGSAVEFYTEGSYMSGDIDLCRRTLLPVPLRKAQDLMAQLRATGGPRSWKVAGLYVDLLGFLENESRAPCRNIDTPFGPISIMPAELALVERALLAYYPAPDKEARVVAKKLIAVCLSGSTQVDWAEVERLAALPDFNITKELEDLKAEVLRDIR